VLTGHSLGRLAVEVSFIFGLDAVYQQRLPVKIDL